MMETLMTYLITGFLGFVSGYWAVSIYFALRNSGRTVNQSGCVAGGDIVGGDIVKNDKEDVDCKYCGAGK